MKNKKNFTMTIEPEIIEKPTCLRNIEAMVGLNVNGIEILEEINGTKDSKEYLYRLIYWLLEKYPEYSSNTMPKIMIPAVDLFIGIDRRDDEYCYNSAPKNHKPYMNPTSKFNDWRYSHTLGYHWMKYPLVFQRKENSMEISWKLHHEFYKNPSGCEYINFNQFKSHLLYSIDNILNYIYNNKNISDTNNEMLELKTLRESIR